MDYELPLRMLSIERGRSTWRRIVRLTRRTRVGARLNDTSMENGTLVKTIRKN